MNQTVEKQYTLEEIKDCIDILTHLVERGENFAALPKELQIEMMKAAGELSSA